MAKTGEGGAVRRRVRPVVTAAEFPLAGGIEMNPVGIGGQLFRGNEADLRQFRRGGPVSGIDAFFAFAPRLLGEAAELADDEGTRRRAQLLPQGADQGEQPLTVLIRRAAVTVGFAPGETESL